MSFLVNIGTLGTIADALIRGDDNLISRMVERKLENLGQNMIRELMPVGTGAFATSSRIEQAVRTRGASEFNRIRSQWLNSLAPPPLPGAGILNRLQNAYRKAAFEASRPQGKHWVWSRSRREWLDQSWKHDWRSQPRDVRGRWIPGRLRHPYVSKGVRRLRAKRRAVARAAVRDAWRNDSGN